MEANVGLAPRMGSPAAFNWLTINIGWCFAVVVAVYTVGRVSGAHLNPAVTLAMALRRGFPWDKVIPFWIAQMIGAFLGAVGVYLVYSDGLVAAGLPNVFTTGPGSTFAQTYWGADAARQAMGSYSILTATDRRGNGTAVLLWGILGAFDSKNLGVGANLGPLFVGFAVLAVGVSLGGASGYAINPACDLAPRIFAALIGSKGCSMAPTGSSRQLSARSLAAYWASSRTISSSPHTCLASSRLPNRCRRRSRAGIAAHSRSVRSSRKADTKRRSSL